MKLAAPDLARGRVREDLASWENEGGAITSSTRKQETNEAPQQLAASVIELAPIAAHGADRGIGDTHSLEGHRDRFCR